MWLRPEDQCPIGKNDLTVKGQRKEDWSGMADSVTRCYIKT